MLFPYLCTFLWSIKFAHPISLLQQQREFKSLITIPFEILFPSNYIWGYFWAALIPTEIEPNRTSGRSCHWAYTASKPMRCDSLWTRPEVSKDEAVPISIMLLPPSSWPPWDAENNVGLKRVSFGIQQNLQLQNWREGLVITAYSTMAANFSKYLQELCNIEFTSSYRNM